MMPVLGAHIADMRLDQAVGRRCLGASSLISRRLGSRCDDREPIVSRPLAALLTPRLGKREVQPDRDAGEGDAFDPGGPGKRTAIQNCG